MVLAQQLWFSTPARQHIGALQELQAAFSRHTQTINLTAERGPGEGTYQTQPGSTLPFSLVRRDAQSPREEHEVQGGAQVAAV